MISDSYVHGFGGLLTCNLEQLGSSVLYTMMDMDL